MYLCELNTFLANKIDCKLKNRENYEQISEYF